MNCDLVKEQLPAYLDLTEPDLSIRRHLSRCEGCRDELAKLDSIKREMAKMVEVTSEPPAALLASLEQIASTQKVTEVVRGHMTRNRRAYLGGVAVLAGAAGAAVLFRRRAA